MMRAGLAWLALLLALPAQADERPMIGDDFSVDRYDIALRPDLATGTVSGRESVTIVATSAGVAKVVFSPNALGIESAAAGGQPLAVTSDAQGIAITLPHALAAGERLELELTFAGTPARGLTAVPGGLYAGYFACDWMVCLQDAPGDKAEVALDLYLAPGVRSLGVGRLDGVEAAGEGIERHRWRSTRPVSAYLIAFAAGSFAEEIADSDAGRMTYLDGTGEGADLAGLFADTPAMAAFFADRAGVPLPDGAYAQLLVPGSQAQESASFSLIGTAELAPEQDDPDAAWVMAHELAHQWWGNLVTCATWRDFWLNEGFATFMVSAWKQHHLGDAAYRQDIAALDARRGQLRERGWDMPLAWDGRYPSLGMRRAVQYSKGALFLATLRETLGDAAFWDGVRHYTRAHAGGTVVSADLQRDMEAASGRDLQPMFASWVYGAGTEVGGEQR